jgi:uncharacterized membrane protein YGL010W
MASKTVQNWLDEYGESHRNPTNKKIHWLCIPPIMMTVIALLSLIPDPFNNTFLHWGSLFVALVMVYYATLSPKLALGMGVIGSLMVGSVYGLEQLSIPLWVSAVSIFVIAWIGQFVGHKIEGKKPSFFQDLQFLLIGPLWLLAAIYRTLGISY